MWSFMGFDAQGLKGLSPEPGVSRGAHYWRKVQETYSELKSCRKLV